MKTGTAVRRVATGQTGVMGERGVAWDEWRMVSQLPWAPYGATWIRETPDRRWEARRTWSGFSDREPVVIGGLRSEAAAIARCAKWYVENLDGTAHAVSDAQARHRYHGVHCEHPARRGMACCVCDLNDPCDRESEDR